MRCCDPYWHNLVMRRMFRGRVAVGYAFEANGQNGPTHTQTQYGVVAALCANGAKLCTHACRKTGPELQSKWVNMRRTKTAPFDFATGGVRPIKTSTCGIKACTMPASTQRTPIISGLNNIEMLLGARLCSNGLP